MWIKTLSKAKQILFIALFLIGGRLYGNNNSTRVRLLFNQDSDLIIKSPQLNALDSIVNHIKRDTLSSLTRVDVASYVSPDGTIERNNRLTILRANAVKQHLIEELQIPDSIIHVTHIGTAWDELNNTLREENMPYANDVELIISSTTESMRNERLKELNDGAAYQEMYNYIYPKLRYSDITIHNIDREPFTPVIPSPLPVQSEEETIKPLFAIKTNLLFDILTLINLEIEIPIKQQWSICGELIFPWWTMDNHEADSRRNRLQLLNGNLEGRYWFGDRSSRPILTGWFAGLYTGVGSYDVEHHAEGYQGEFVIAAGVSGGYAHTINKAQTLRLEYSIGIGYLQTNYHHYEAEFCDNDHWHAIEQSSGRYKWFGPTRAKVSLSWLIYSDFRFRRY